MNSKQPLSLEELDKAYKQAAEAGSDGIREIVVPAELAPIIQQELEELDREYKI